MSDENPPATGDAQSTTGQDGERLRKDLFGGFDLDKHLDSEPDDADGWELEEGEG